MVEASGVVIKFLHVRVTFVDSRVLSKSTLRPAHLSALCTDPVAIRGGHSGSEKEKAGIWKVDARVLGIDLTRRRDNSGLVFLAAMKFCRVTGIPLPLVPCIL